MPALMFLSRKLCILQLLSVAHLTQEENSNDFSAHVKPIYFQVLIIKEVTFFQNV